MKVARNQLKNAELVSLIGACVATGGVALYLQSWLDPLKFVLLLSGLAIHAAAMFYRQRLERAADHALTRWEKSLYWSCWVILATLAIYLVVAARS
jgi:Mn2+/Fe2+ NRAMP family transporter